MAFLTTNIWRDSTCTKYRYADLEYMVPIPMQMQVLSGF
jgi:hypothetical protein